MYIYKNQTAKSKPGYCDKLHVKLSYFLNCGSEKSVLRY